MFDEDPLQWLRRQRHHVIKTQSSYWFDISPRIYQAFPYHKLIVPTQEEIKELFRQNRAIAIRYSTPLDQPEGQISYHVIHDRNGYDISTLPKKARHDVIHGLQYASYDLISMDRMAQEGWNLREDTLIRQGRKNAETRDFWENLCKSADGLPGFEAWGALHDGALVASLLACTIDNTVGIFYQQSLTQHLKYGINNTLTYVFTREILNRPDVSGIFYGLHSLDAPASVDEFKFRMGYSPKPVRQRVVFNPSIAPLIHPFSHSLLKVLINISPASHQLSKAEGMVRFYLQGKRPLPEQEWPDVLQELRGSIIAKEE